MNNSKSGQTLIDPEEAEALKPYIAYRWQLDEYEQNNILKAKHWSSTSRILKKDYPTDSGLRLLHKKMFEDVWKWAGQYRKTEKNIGNVLSYQVTEEVKKLCDDVKHQLANKKLDLTVIAISFHHRLTCIHPFPNGNGRLAREAADILLKYNGLEAFSWGANKQNQDSVRTEYIKALRKADSGDFSKLFKFLKE